MANEPGEGEVRRRGSGPSRSLWSEEEVTLLDLVNRTIDRGIVLHAEAVISVAEIDLVELILDLRLKAVEGGVFGPAPERPVPEGDG